MKKIWVALISVFLIFGVSACKKEKGEKFLLDGQENVTSSLTLSVEDFDEKMDDKENFIFFVHSSMCGSCKSFKTYALEPFVQETKSVIYEVDSSEIFNSKYEKKLKVKYTPTLYIIFKGEVLEKEVYDSKNELFTSKDGLKKYLTNYVYLPTLISIEESELDKKIVEKESFVIYFGWNLCGDCQKLHQRVLDQYLIKQMNGKKMYYFETHDYITTANTENNLWAPFTKKYGLDVYRGGKVPTIQVYKNGELSDYFVYYNDVKDDNGVIVESFLEELIGQKLTEEEHLKKYDEKIIEFLNKVL